MTLHESSSSDYIGNRMHTVYEFSSNMQNSVVKWDLSLGMRTYSNKHIHSHTTIAVKTDIALHTHHSGTHCRPLKRPVIVWCSMIWCSLVPQWFRWFRQHAVREITGRKQWRCCMWIWWGTTKQHAVLVCYTLWPRVKTLTPPPIILPSCPLSLPILFPSEPLMVSGHL